MSGRRLQRIAQGVAQELRLVAVGLQFLTRLPVPVGGTFDPRWLTQCVRHFPLVGACIGALGAAVMAGASLLWPPVVVALLTVAFSGWLTAAFHEDGLADTLDALTGWAPRERALEIMKDSRIGSYGAVGLLAVWALRAALLATMLTTQGVAVAAVAWVAAHMLARVLPVVMMARLPYAGHTDQAKARPLTQMVPGRDALVALLWCLPLLFTPVPVLRWLAALLALAVIGWLLARWLLRRLGGFTGDTLGAAEQLGEVAVLLVLSAQVGV